MNVVSYGQLHLEPINNFSYATLEVVAPSQSTLFPMMIFTLEELHMAKKNKKDDLKANHFNHEIVLEPSFLQTHLKSPKTQVFQLT